MKKISKKCLFSASIPTLCLIGTGCITGAFGYRFNLTSSLPVGIWKITDNYARGSYVSACVPPNAPMMHYAMRHAYLPDGICPGGFAPLLKKIAAMEGDKVSLTFDSFTVNGHPIQNTATIKYDATHRLPILPRGTYLIRKNQIWLFSNKDPRSFDSRYFGPINSANILHGMKPVFVTPASPRMNVAFPEIWQKSSLRRVSSRCLLAIMGDAAWGSGIPLLALTRS